MLKIALKDVLKAKHKTMTELHQATGISMNALSILSNNKTNGIQFSTLEAICSYLAISPSDLFVITEGEYSLSIDDKTDAWAGSQRLYSAVITPEGKLEQNEVSSADQYRVFIEIPKKALSESIMIVLGIPVSFRLPDDAFKGYHSLIETTALLNNISAENVLKMLRQAASGVLSKIENGNKVKTAYVVMRLTDDEHQSMQTSIIKL